MDQPPPIPHDAAKDILGSVGTWIMWPIVAIISGSVSAVRRAGSMQVAAYWVVLSALIGPGFAALAVTYWDVNVYVGAVICLVVGLMIAGIAGQIDKLNKRVGDASLPIPMLPQETGHVTPGEPPSIPVIKEPGK